VDSRYTIKTVLSLNQNILPRAPEAISAGLLLVERQETERPPSASNQGLNDVYEGPTRSTQRSETLIIFFSFVENLERKAQLTQCWLVGELADLQFPAFLWSAITRKRIYSMFKKQSNT